MLVRERVFELGICVLVEYLGWRIVEAVERRDDDVCGHGHLRPHITLV